MSGPPSSTFIVREVLKFRREYYSWYDDAFISEFQSLTHGGEKYWWLMEKRPESWTDYFEAVEE